jgi:hypothetical protein
MAAHPINFGRVLEGLVKATFGPGALGRLGTVAMGAMAVVGAIGLALAFANPTFALVAIAAVLGIVSLFLILGFSYATKYPQFAAMDGAQIVRALNQEGAMKRLPGLPPIPDDDPLVTNPGSLPAPSMSGEADA